MNTRLSANEATIAVQNAPTVVLLVGSRSERALQAVTSEALGERLRLTALADVAAAIEWVDREQIEPAVMVVCPSWPGEISDREILSLRRVAPLARMCSVLPSWCEGETRSGRPWPGVWRIYEHAWPQRAQREMAALAAGQPTVWNLPATATAEEQSLGELGLEARRGRPGESSLGTIAMLAAAVEAGQALADACRSLGYDVTVWRQPPADRNAQWNVLVWDTSAEMAARREVVEQLKAVGQGAPIVAVLGFPRPDQVDAARKAGVTAVLSKPFLLADLAWQLKSL